MFPGGLLHARHKRILLAQGEINEPREERGKLPAPGPRASRDARGSGGPLSYPPGGPRDLPRKVSVQALSGRNRSISRRISWTLA